MCLKCILLGALVNAGVDPNDETDESRFRCESLSPFDFTPSHAEASHLIDKSASEYLSGTLDRFRSQFGIDFNVLSVESDGSCLPHAISRCLVGHEVYYDALRLDLQVELRNNAKWYRSVLNSAEDGSQVYDEEEWSKLEWPRILRAAAPTYGQRAGEDRWLGPEHVLGFSNLLGRPILLLNTPEIMSDPHHGLRGGMFLPLRRTRAEIMRQHNGNFPSPIVIGYANATGHHYVALVRSLSPLDMISTFLQGPFRKLFDTHWNLEVRSGLQVPLRDPLLVPRPTNMIHEEEELLVEHPVTGRGMLLLLPSGYDKSPNRTITIEKIFPRWASLLEEGMLSLAINNGFTARSRALKTLQAYVRCLMRAQQDAVYGKYERLSKVSVIPLDKSAGCRWIAGIRGAQEILEACGYELEDGRCFRLRQGGPPICKDAKGGTSSAVGPSEEDLRRSEGVIADDPLTSLRHIEEMLKRLSDTNAANNETTIGGYELPGGEWEPRLLGPLPRYSWLGVGPPSIIDAKSGKELVAGWPPASICSADHTSQLLWVAAKSHYGSGRVSIPDNVWEFGIGSDGGDFCQRLNIELQARFLTLTRGVFGTFPEVMLKIQMQGVQYGSRAEIIVVCPDCKTESIPDLPPHLLRAVGDELCEAHCPNVHCGARLNLKKTYRQCLADAVAEAAKGSLGGVWICLAESSDSSSYDSGLEEILGDGMTNYALSRVCGALNVGISDYCISCGSENPNAKTKLPKKQRKMEGGVAVANDVVASLQPDDIENEDVNTEAQMLRMMVDVLTEAYTSKKKRGISKVSEQTSISSVSLATKISQGEEKRSKMAVVDEQQELIFDLNYLMGMEKDNNKDGEVASDTSTPNIKALDHSEQTLPSPMEQSSNSRSISCPAHVSFSVRPHPEEGTVTEGTLRMLAVRSDGEGVRQSSDPITQKERNFREQESGIDLKALTCNAALQLLHDLRY